MEPSHAFLPALHALQAYQRAIERTIRAKRQQDGEAHVLDLGCGTGILSLLAARAGGLLHLGHLLGRGRSAEGQ